MEQPLPTPVQVETSPSPTPEVKAHEDVKGKVKEWTEKDKDWLAKLWGKTKETPRKVLEEVEATQNQENELIETSERVAADKKDQIQTEISGLPKNNVGDSVEDSAKPLLGNKAKPGGEIESIPVYELPNDELEKLFGKRVKNGVYIDRKRGIVTKIIDPKDNKHVEQLIFQKEFYRKWGGFGLVQGFVGEGNGYWQQQFVGDCNLFEFMEAIVEGSRDPEDASKFPLVVVNELKKAFTETVEGTGMTHGDLCGMGVSGVTVKREINLENIRVKVDDGVATKLYVIDWAGNHIDELDKPGFIKDEKDRVNDFIPDIWANFRKVMGRKRPMM